MALGPGKYDKLATLVRKRSKGRAVLVVVLDGEHGSGFSVQGEIEYVVAMRLPHLLRTVAFQIEGDTEAGAEGDACPSCGSKERDKRAVMSLRPLASCRDAWHESK